MTGRSPRSWGQLRGLARAEPESGRQLPTPSAECRVGAEATQCVAQFSGPPRSREPREGRTGSRSYPVGPVCSGGATSVPYSGLGRNAARPGLGPASKGRRGRRTDPDSAVSLLPVSNFSLNLAAPRRGAGRAQSLRAQPGHAPRSAHPRGWNQRQAPLRAGSAPAARPRAGHCLGPAAGVEDQREGGAVARPRERRRQSARRGVPGPATSGALGAQRRGRVKVKAQRRPRASSPRRPESEWPGTRRRARAAPRWGQILRCPCTLRPPAPGPVLLRRTCSAPFACPAPAHPEFRAQTPAPPGAPLLPPPFCPRGLL